MRAIIGFARAILGLFFDDGSLALAVLAILAATAILVRGDSSADAIARVFLVGAVIAALLENVLRTARAHRIVRGGVPAG